jgi:hypothetical protein
MIGVGADHHGQGGSAARGRKLQKKTRKFPSGFFVGDVCAARTLGLAAEATGDQPSRSGQTEQCVGGGFGDNGCAAGIGELVNVGR